MSNWIECQYDDDGEICNPEFVNAPSDSFWWVDSRSKLHTVVMNCEIYFRPDRIARVVHPDEA
jgi:hypothetical protein